MRADEWRSWCFLILLGFGLLEGAFLPEAAATTLQERDGIERPLRPSAEAMFEAGRRFEKGDGVEQDHKTAFAWYLKAARLGLGRAQTKVGQCYEQGLGVRQDFVRARKWYGRAIRHGDRQGGEEGMGRLAAETIPPP